MQGTIIDSEGRYVHMIERQKQLSMIGALCVGKHSRHFWPSWRSITSITPKGTSMKCNDKKKYSLETQRGLQREIR